jgi:hypothetical protein
MDKFHISNFYKGWFIGDFTPTLNSSKDFEIAFKSYKAGDFETIHYHKIATEYTLVTLGIVSFNNITYSKGDIVKVFPFEKIAFKSITDSETVVIKIPSSKNDKFED